MIRRITAAGAVLLVLVASPPPIAAQGTPTADADTVRIALPTGQAETDRPNVQEAFDRLGPGDVVLFAPGTYMLEEGARLTVPDVTVLGHPDGTELRGCEPERFDLPAGGEMEAVRALAMGCTGLILLADRQTVRGLTFDHAWHGILAGVPPLPAPEAEDGAPPPGFGGHLIENNVFRHVPNGVRVVGPTDDVTVIRDNDVENAYHAFNINGAPVLVLDNRITVPEPGSVPAAHYPESGVIVGPGPPPSSCAGSRVEGNVIEGTVHGVQVIGGTTGTCADHEIRDNDIWVREVSLPPDYPRHLMDLYFGDGSEGSTVTGIAIRLDGETLGPVDDTVAATVARVLIEGNRVLSGHGLGIQVARASNNRIVGNHVEGIRRRSPFPGLTWGDDPDRWREANGSGIWVSPGSDDNEIVGNTFEDVASDAIVLEGDGNRVELGSASDVVRDLGSENEVVDRTDATERAPPPAEAGGLEVGREPALADTLRDLAVESMALWNRLDPDAWLSLLADDIRWYYSATSIDRAGVEEMVRGLMSVMREPRYRVLSDPDVQTLGPDAAVVSFPVLQAATGPGGGKLEQPTGLTFVYQRSEAGWKVARVHESLGTPANSVVEGIVLDRTRDLAAAWERLDADAYLSHFSDDLTFYFEGARVSRREFEAVVRGTIGSLRESTFELTDPEVEVLGRQAAAVSFGLRERMVDASGGETELNGALTLVYERRGGQWLVVRAHESLRRPTEAERR